MLLLEPSDEGKAPKLWTVLGRGKAPKTLVAALDDITATAALTKSGLPEGWTIIPNRLAAEYLEAASDLAASAARVREERG